MNTSFISLKEGDRIYHIKMDESDIIEKGNTCLQTEYVSGIIRTTDMHSVSVRLQGGGMFTAPQNYYSHRSIHKQDDEVNLSFDVYATSKEKCVEEAQKLVTERLRVLEIIKRRISESETGLILADNVLEMVDLKEEPTLEEFASMALS